MKKIFVIVGVLVLTFIFVSPASAYDLTIGNSPVGDRTYVDTYQNFSIVDTNNPAQYDGIVSTIEYYARNTNPFKFLIVDAAHKVQWKSDLITPAASGVQTYTPSAAPVIHKDWNIGMYFQSTGTIPFDYNSAAAPAYYENNNAGEPVIGEVLSVAGTTERYYSFLASGWQFRVGDADNDGVPDNVDLCTDTPVDGTWSEQLGTNRWQVQSGSEGLGWYQNKPAKKGDTIVTFGHDMSYTYGCNGHQILDMLTEKLGKNAMNGHYKFGLSTGLLEEFHQDYSDGVLNGLYKVDTLSVDLKSTTGTNSNITLATGIQFLFKASGTWTNRPGEIVDAKYTTMNNWSTWSDAPSGGFPNGLLDLQVNNGFIDWGLYSAVHEYTHGFTGVNAKVNFRVFDGDVNSNTPYSGWYSDNVGNLTVDIYAQL